MYDHGYGVMHFQATNVDFANRLYNSSEVSSSKRFSKPKLSQTGFAIEHYAGGVGYKTDNFLIKNKDFVVAEHQQLMQSSDQPFVCMLFPAEPEAPADGNNKVRMLATYESEWTSFHSVMLALWPDIWSDRACA